MQYTKDTDKLILTKNIYDQETGEVARTDSTSYTRQYLASQIAAITAQRDQMIQAKTDELAFVTSLVAKCNELSVDETVITE